MGAQKEPDFRDYTDSEIQFWDAGDGVPLKKDLDNLEADLQVALPKEYRRFQLRHGAVMVAAADNVWPDAKLGKGGPYWTFLKGFMIFGLGQDCPDHMDIRAVTNGFHKEFPDLGKLVPFFAHNNTSDFFCFDDRGQVVLWSHDVPDEAEDQGVGFDEFVVAETKLLVLRKDAVKAAVGRYGKRWREKAMSPELL